MTTLDELAAALQVAVQAAQMDMAAREAALFRALSAELSALITPAALQIGLLTLDLPVGLEEVEDPSVPGATLLAVQIGSAPPAGTPQCHLTLSYTAGPPAGVDATINGNRIVLSEPSALYQPNKPQQPDNPGNAAP